jgi:signal peptidase I
LNHVSGNTGGKLKKSSIPTERKSREFIEGLLVALIAALIIRQFIVQAYRIPTSSMEDTLLVGDFLLVNKYVYGMRTPDWIGIPYTDIGFSIPWVRIPGFKKPQQNDVVIFKYPLDPSLDYIKRCIATGGQTVELRDKMTFVDGKRFPDAPHAKFADKNLIIGRNQGRFNFPTFENNRYGSRDNFGPLEIPEHKYFMMGDNRDRSSDSRVWGFVDFDHIVGEALIIYLSWDSRENFKFSDLFLFFRKIRFNRIADVIR